MKFDKRQTNIAKGVAMLLLLWHHVFYKSKAYYGLFDSAFRIQNIPIESYFAKYFKVCVAIFLFLSGYGIYKSWHSNRRRTLRPGQSELSVGQQARFVKNHWIKLMMDYWFVYLIFVPMGILFNVYFWEVYKGSIRYGLMDFFGLSFFWKAPSMNPTWWFMSIIIAFYLLFPLLVKWLDKFPELFLAVALGVMLFPNVARSLYISRYFEWIPPLFLGMFFAKFDCFERLQKRLPLWWQGLALTVPLLALTAYLRYKTGENVRFDALFAIAVILFCYLVLSRIPLLSRALEWLGGISGAVFMFHTFVFLTYGKQYIYWFRYPPLIFAVMLAVCCLIAVGLKYLKKLIRYDRLTMLLVGGKKKKQSEK